MVVSFTIENTDDWNTLNNIITKNVSWDDNTTKLLKNHVSSIQNSSYCRYIIQIDGITYINLIIKTDNPDIMICDYPLKGVNLSKSNRWKNISYILLGVSIVGCIIYFII